MKNIKIIISTIIVEILFFSLYFLTGYYNVSVMSPDPGVIRWAFSTISDHSVAHHAKNIKITGLDDTTLIEPGFRHYNEMCVGCHGAPGVKRGDAGKGLYPHPPDLAESAKELPPRNLFWIIKNGVKSTGMPSFGKTHSDQQIKTIVAFLEKMKNMKAQDYARMRNKIAATAGGHDRDK